MHNIISNTARPTSNEPLAFQNDEETLVLDTRSILTPSQLVEQKLIGRLKETPLLMSQMQRRLKPGPR